jgi:hypothetical protein
MLTMNTMLTMKSRQFHVERPELFTAESAVSAEHTKWLSGLSGEGLLGT